MNLNANSNGGRRLPSFALVGVSVIVVAAVILASRRPAQTRPDTDENATSESSSIADLQGEPNGDVASQGVADGMRRDGVIPMADLTWNDIDNPAQDGWTSELHSELVGQSLKRIGNVLFGIEGSISDLRGLVGPNFEGQSLMPTALETVFEDETVCIQRWIEPRETKVETFPNSLQSIANAWASHSNQRFQFKIIRVQQNGRELLTQQHVTISGNESQPTNDANVSSGRLIEQHATWTCRWTLSNANDLSLDSIRLIDFEQATSKSGRSLFSDCTASVLRNVDCYRSQFLYGLNYWLDRNQDMRYFAPLGNPGLAVGDVDGDGLDDLYVCQENNLPNRLFLQQTDGTVREVAAEWQVDWLEGSRSALLVDLDNDGDQDLVVALMGGVVIASNERTAKLGGRFVIRDVLNTDDDTTSLSAADYDLDGDLDLYVCVDYPNDAIGTSRQGAGNEDGSTIQIGAANRVYHDANSAGRNNLFRNEHSHGQTWKFIDATSQSGLHQNNRRFTWAAAWADYDDDGDQDLYVANDFGRNNLYENRGGNFVDVAKETNAEDSASGMSVAWADVNRDGLMDAYVSNMFSSAGSRVTHHSQFKQNATQDVRSRLQRFARGSSLLMNRGGSRFEDTSVKAGVTLGRWAWSSNFLDVNNDGWQDIAVANGYITAEDTSDL